MTIGNKIKTLRNQKGITQEKLAQSLNVSFQAVSKWENNIALPDITLVPKIASFFGISLDELFDFNLAHIEEEVHKIIDSASLYRESDPAKSKKILEDGLLQFPNHDMLLNCLLYVTDYSHFPDDTISIANRILDTSIRSEIKYDALRFLAYAYKAKQDIASAEAALDQIPEIYFTKLTEKAFLFSGDKKYEAAEKQKRISSENLLQMIAKLAEFYEEKNEIQKAIHELNTGIMLIEVLNQNYFDMYHTYFQKQLTRLKGIC